AGNPAAWLRPVVRAIYRLVRADLRHRGVPLLTREHVRPMFGDQTARRRAVVVHLDLASRSAGSELLRLERYLADQRQAAGWLAVRLAGQQPRDQLRAPRGPGAADGLSQGGLAVDHRQLRAAVQGQPGVVF